MKLTEQLLANAKSREEKTKPEQAAQTKHEMSGDDNCPECQKPMEVASLMGGLNSKVCWSCRIALPAHM